MDKHPEILDLAWPTQEKHGEKAWRIMVQDIGIPLANRSKQAAEDPKTRQSRMFYLWGWLEGIFEPLGTAEATPADARRESEKGMAFKFLEGLAMVNSFSFRPKDEFLEAIRPVWETVPELSEVQLSRELAGFAFLLSRCEKMKDLGGDFAFFLASPLGGQFPLHFAKAWWGLGAMIYFALDAERTARIPAALRAEVTRIFLESLDAATAPLTQAFLETTGSKKFL